MKTIAPIMQKGGVGKTTATHNIGNILAELGFRVLSIDLDSQGNLTTMYDVEDNGLTISNIFKSPSMPIEKLCQQLSKNHFIIPSNIHLAMAVESIAGRVHREKILHKQLKTISDNFDFCIIDCPPTLGNLTINAVYAADFFIIPVTASRFALQGISDLFQVISDIKEVEQENIDNYIIVKSMIDSRASVSVNELEKGLEGYKVANTIIRRCESINKAQFYGKSVYEFDKNSKAAIDAAKLVTELLTEWNYKITGANTVNKKEACYE